MRRQSMPSRWLIVNAEPDHALWRAVRKLPRRSGVLLIHRLRARDLRKLRHVAGLRQLKVVAERPRTAARVHNIREMTRELLRRPPMVLISPLYATRSHPDWNPLARMRAAALARLANRQAIALGGMNQDRYAAIARLGFIGWAGMSAFRI